MRVPAGTLKMLDPAEDCYDLGPAQVRERGKENVQKFKVWTRIITGGRGGFKGL